MQDDENTPEMRLRFMKIREAPGLSARCRGKWGYPIPFTENLKPARASSTGIWPFAFAAYSA